MNLAAHLANLEDKHSELETMIAQEVQRPIPDQTRVTKLKREKLRLKEELTRRAIH